MIKGFILMLSLSALVLPGLHYASGEGEELIGTPAPEWNNRYWINSQPIHLSELRGKVVLVRFLMESSCPMCRASAPYLNQFFSDFKQKGLVVIGMYTPKPEPRKVALDTVQKYVRDYGFQFPVALDNDWSTLNRYWLDHIPNADFTSVSFLIDKSGIVRYIHTGGAYSKADAENIRKKIDELLK